MITQPLKIMNEITQLPKVMDEIEFASWAYPKKEKTIRNIRKEDLTNVCEKNPNFSEYEKNERMYDIEYILTNFTINFGKLSDYFWKNGNLIYYNCEDPSFKLKEFDPILNMFVKKEIIYCECVNNEIVIKERKELSLREFLMD